jgi:hypothetical protein
MKYKNIIKLRLSEIELLAVVPTQLKFSIVKDHDEPTILLIETVFCTWECFNMGAELPTKVMLGQTLVLMQMTFLNNVRKVSRSVLSRTSYSFHHLSRQFSGYCKLHHQGQSGCSIKLTTHLYLAWKLTVGEVLPPLPHTSLWHSVQTEGQLHLLFTSLFLFIVKYCP